MNDEKRPCDEDAKDDYENCFDYYDVDGKGYIDKEDIRNVALEFNEEINE